MPHPTSVDTIRPNLIHLCIHDVRECLWCSVGSTNLTWSCVFISLLVSCGGLNHHFSSVDSSIPIKEVGCEALQFLTQSSASRRGLWESWLTFPVIRGLSSGLLLSYLDCWDVTDTSSRVDRPAKWKSRQNRKRAAHPALGLQPQSPESTHQWSSRQRMLSIKWNTTELLISLEKIFLNYHKHPQCVLQWISVFGANSDHSEVLGGSLPEKLLSWNNGELGPLGWFPELWWSSRPHCPWEKEGKTAILPFWVVTTGSFYSQIQEKKFFLI